jgi:putative RecB family exonuclease
VLDTAECIAQEKFEPQENQYCPCDFPEYCPLYRHKYAPPQETESKAELEIPIKDIVERYVLTQLRIKELEVELKEMRDCIFGFCESQGLRRVYGDKHAITYRLIHRMGFNEDEVRALLEPEGLWQKVISFDDKKLKELMETEALAVNLLKKLEKMKQINKSYPQLFVKKLTEEE